MAGKHKNRCSFCGRSEDEVTLLLTGMNGHICDECVRQAEKIVQENLGSEVHVKTGTMDGVKAYAGYVIAANGQTLAFTIVCNGHDCSQQEVAAKLNKILYKIATIY